MNQDDIEFWGGFFIMVVAVYGFLWLVYQISLMVFCK